MTLTTESTGRESGPMRLWLLVSAVLVSSLMLGTWQFVVNDMNADTALLFTRYTARISFFFFLPVFVASSLKLLYPGPASIYLMRNRRSLGLAFALAHLIHLIAIIIYFQQDGSWFTSSDIPALVIYLMLGLMAVTSNTFSRKRLRLVWGVVHKIGIYGVFIGFFTTYLGRVTSYAAADIDPALKEPFEAYVILLVLVSSAWLLRIVAFWKKRRA